MVILFSDNGFVGVTMNSIKLFKNIILGFILSCPHKINNGQNNPLAYIMVHGRLN